MHGQCDSVAGAAVDFQQLAALPDSQLGVVRVFAKLVDDHVFRFATIVIAVNELRVIFNELGRRHVAAGHIDRPDYIFMLLDEEVEPFVASPTGWNETLAERHGIWRELFDREPPYFIRDAVVPPISTWAKRGSAEVTAVSVGDVLPGIAGCPGVITGKACVILDPADPRDLGPGDILIAPQTDPGWTPLLLTAGGLVMETGGAMSHGANVAREYSIPAVVGVAEATERIRTGQRITVDGGAGTVTFASENDVSTHPEVSQPEA